MSVGHVARVVEVAGIPTVVILIRAFRFRAEEMGLPRTIVTRHLLGRPLGAPHDVEGQRKVVLASLSLLEKAESGGAIVEFQEPYRTL